MSGESNKLEVRNLDAYFGKVHALHAVSLNFPERRVTAIIGPSGCGAASLVSGLGPPVESKR